MNKADVQKFKQKLTQQVTENPLLSLGVFAATATAVSKLIDANTDRYRAKTNAREIARREHQTYTGSKKRR